MHRILCYSLFDYYNYGNVLQNYAVQYIYDKLGYRAELLTIQDRNKTKQEYYIKKCLSFFLPKPKRYSFKHYCKFYEFVNKHIYLRHIENSNQMNLIMNDEYDYYSIGSDQVWNPKDINSFSFLSFAEENKRICISPSFGVDRIPDDMKEKYRSGLLGFRRINVRENTGASIVRNLTNQECTVILDPTFALKKEEWEKICKEDFALNKNYIFCYFLGDERHIRTINKIAEELNSEIVDISDRKNKYYSAGPSEFVSMIKHAKLVCTDSFHAVAFSITYNVPFLYADRRRNGEENMSSRIKNLIDTLGLLNNKLDSETFSYDIDYTSINIKLEVERKRIWEEMSCQISKN